MSNTASKIEMSIESETERGSNQPTHKKFFVAGVIVFAVSVISTVLIYRWFVYLNRFVITDDAYLEAEFFPVSTKVPGMIKQVLVEEGDQVKKDQVLLIIDGSDFEFERKFKQMKLEKAKLDYSRAETLHKGKAISDFDYENAYAAVKSAQVDLEGTEIKLKYTKIIAPANGVIAKRSAQIGQVIQPGQPLFTIVDNAKPWIKANFKETQIRDLRIGQAVKVKIDGFSDQNLRGKVEAIFPSSGAKLSILPPENATGNFTRVVQRIPVKIGLSKEEVNGLGIRPGMSAEVEIDTASKEAITH